MSANLRLWLMGLISLAAVYVTVAAKLVDEWYWPDPDLGKAVVLFLYFLGIGVPLMATSLYLVLTTVLKVKEGIRNESSMGVNHRNRNSADRDRSDSL
ncbi:hypothetical protein HY439_00705 [Candidatus Microgenomates bacterium]|nr:hypothetical protein [Candidatus Microgenomates bacterium]